MVEFTVNAFTVDPPPCPVTYSCAVSANSPRQDICNLPSYGSFDAITGFYQFMSIDMDSFPAGTYELIITGTVGTQSDSFTLPIEFVDPCSTAEITLLASPLIDDSYTLRDNAQVQSWNYSDLFTIATQVDCGPISVDFYNEGDKSTLDSDLFGDVRDAAGSNTFTVLYTEDVQKAAVYPISYRTYHTQYPDNYKEVTTAFTVTVIDPCDEPIRVTPSALVDQEYTITQNLFEYQIPVYTADPLWCVITYTYTITDTAGDEALTFVQDSRTFSFE